MWDKSAQLKSHFVWTVAMVWETFIFNMDFSYCIMHCLLTWMASCKLCTFLLPIVHVEFLWRPSLSYVGGF